MKYAREFAIVALVSALALWGAVQTFRVKAEQNRTQAVALEYQQYKLDQQAKLQREEQRRNQAIEEVRHEANQRIQQIEADATASRASADSMRRQLARLRAASCATTAAGGQTTADPIGVLADVLARADQRAQQLAEYADRSHAAGLACERAFDALWKGQ